MGNLELMLEILEMVKWVRYEQLSNGRYVARYQIGDSLAGCWESQSESLEDLIRIVYERSKSWKS